MAKLGWIPAGPNLTIRAEQLVRGLIERAGGPAVAAGSSLLHHSIRGSLELPQSTLVSGNSRPNPGIALNKFRLLDDTKVPSSRIG